MAEAQRVFGELARENLHGLVADAFADGLSWAWGEMAAIHPFRDVNTRSQHIMFNQLCRDAGWVIDWSCIPGDVFAHARTLAIVDDHSGIEALIRTNLKPLEGGTTLMLKPVRNFRARGISRSPAVLDRELKTVRDNRRRIPPDSAGSGI